MNSAILINLDYERYPRDVCTRLWQAIETAMQNAGFAKHKHLFLTQAGRTDAVRSARAAVAFAEAQLTDAGTEVFDAVSEFYCFDYAHLNDLLVPSNEEVVVDYVDALTFFTVLEARQAA